jgi:hypothetical protein
MKNARAPVNPETDLNANQMNLTFWQAAGASRTTPMAVILFDGATPEVLLQSFAFDPDQLLDTIQFNKLGTGSYNFTFEATYKDEQGQDRPFAPKAAVAMIQGGAAGDIAVPGFISGQVVPVQVRDAMDANVDGTFLLLVW